MDEGGSIFILFAKNNTNVCSQRSPECIEMEAIQRGTFGHCLKQSLSVCIINGYSSLQPRFLFQNFQSCIKGGAGGSEAVKVIVTHLSQALWLLFF